MPRMYYRILSINSVTTSDKLSSSFSDMRTGLAPHVVIEVVLMPLTNIEVPNLSIYEGILLKDFPPIPLLSMHFKLALNTQRDDLEMIKTCIEEIFDQKEMVNNNLFVATQDLLKSLNNDATHILFSEFCGEKSKTFDRRLARLTQHIERLKKISHPKCYRPNNNPYPLCVGLEKQLQIFDCDQCCLFTKYKGDDFGVE